MHLRNEKVEQRAQYQLQALKRALSYKIPCQGYCILSFVFDKISFVLIVKNVSSI